MCDPKKPDTGGQPPTDLRRFARGKCSSCQAAIIWAQSAKGHPSPIDAEPVSEGNVVLDVPDDPREPPIARVLKKGQHAPMPRYVSHFATCPNADTHRKGA